MSVLIWVTIILLGIVAPYGECFTSKQKSMFFPEQGVLIEPIGLGTVNPPNILTKVAVKISKRGMYDLVESCSGLADQHWMNVLNQTLTNEFDEAWSIIPKLNSEVDQLNQCDITNLSCTKEQHISKRSPMVGFALLAGIMILTTFCYGVWTEISASQAISDLQQSHDEVLKVIESNLEKADQMYKIGKHTVVKTEDLILKSYDTLYRDICKEKSSLHYQMLRNHLLESFYKLKSEIRSSLKGKVDRFILSPSHLSALLKDNPLFENTIYMNDPSTFYLFSESSLITADHENHILYYFIKTPRILSNDITNIYQTYNLGWELDNMRYKIGLPDYLAVLKTKINPVSVRIEPTHCKVVANFWICSHQSPIITKDAKCLNTLLSGRRIDECSILTRSQGSQLKAVADWQIGRSGNFPMGRSNNRIMGPDNLVVQVTNYNF